MFDFRTVRIRTVHRLAVVMAGLVLTVTTAVSEAVTIARDGQAQATIIVADDAAPHTQQAARDLADLLHRITGGEFAVSATVPATGDRLWVGHHPKLAAYLPDTDLTASEPESFVIVAAEHDLAIVGHDRVYGDKQTESGTAVGVYAFLDDHLGVRWLWPGETGLDIVAQPTVVFEPFTQRFVPRLRERQLRMPSFTRPLRYLNDTTRPAFLVGSKLNEMNQAMMVWRRYQRLEYGIPHHPQWFHASHAFMHWWNQFSKTHPEVFAMQRDGTRTPDPNPSRAKLCLSNPQAWQLWIEEVERTLEQNPWQTIFSAGPNDSAFRGICTCEDCRALDPETGPMVRLSSLNQEYDNVATTDRVVYFWNQLGRLLKEKYPDRDYYVAGFGYGPYVTPPVERKLDDNVAIAYVGNITTTNQAQRMANRDAWRQWADGAGMVIWRPNLFHDTTLGYLGTPVLATRQLAEDIRFLADHRMVGINIDSIFQHWATQGPMYYLLAKLAWDPYADAEAVMADYYQRGFGPAATYVQQYYDRLEQIHYQRVEQRYADRGDMLRQLPVFYNEQVLTELAELLDSAQQAVADADDRYQHRVVFVADGLAFLKAQMVLIQAMADLKFGRGPSMRELVIQAGEAHDALLDVLEDSFGRYSISASHYLGWVQNRSLVDDLGPLNDFHLGYLKQDDTVTHLPAAWDFRLDPQEIGQQEKWYQNTAAEGWQPLLITAWWGDQLQSDDPVDPEPINPTGSGWYRLTFDSPPLKPGERIWLQFGAVDESCWVYVNGRLVGEQVYDANVNADAWKQPRRFDITDVIHRSAEPNLVVVRVESLAGAGGIWRGALLKVEPKPIIASDWSGGDHDLSWQVRDRGTDARSAGFDDTVFNGRLSLSHQPGQYVNEPSLRIVKHQGDLMDVSASVREHLPAGRYRLRLGYLQQPASAAADDTYVSIRLNLGRGDEQTSIWAVTPKQHTDQWATLLTPFELKQPVDQVHITLFIRGQGAFVFDELLIESAH